MITSIYARIFARVLPFCAGLRFGAEPLRQWCTGDAACKGVATLAMLALAGCGGGGGGGGEQISIALSPSPLTGSYYPDQLPATLTVTGQISGSISSNMVYVLVDDPGNTFATGPLTLVSAGPSSYQTNIKTASGLTIGAHSNTLELRVCGDAQCHTLFGAARLPYTITVKAPAFALAPPNPFNVSAIKGGGTALQVQMVGAPSGNPAYAVITDPDNVFSTQPATLAASDLYPPVGETQNFTGVIAVQQDLAARQYTGNLTLKICGDSACQQVYGSFPLPYAAQILDIVAGQAGITGNTDGTGASALFNVPTSLGLDASENLYIADKGNNEIRKISPASVVRTVLQPNSQFPVGFELKTDPAGNSYFSYYNGIAKVTPDGTVSQFRQGYLTYNSLATDNSGNVYYTTANSQGAGIVGKAATDGSTRQLANGTTFQSIGELAADSTGNVYVGNGNQISKIAPDQTVSSLVSNLGSSPVGMVVEKTGNMLVATGIYVDTNVLRVTPDGTQRTIIYGGAIHANGAHAGFSGLALTAEGVLYLVDEVNDVILVTTPP